MTQKATSPRHERKAGKVATDVLKVVVPLAISAVMLLWMLSKVNISKVVSIMKQGVDYRFILLMCALIVLSHIIRGIRWGIQLRAAGVPRMPWLAESVSIFGAYALNLVFPYLGEAWRCVYVSRRENCKLSTVVGTDIGDRASDAVVILLLILLAVVVARPALHAFLVKYPLGKYIESLASDGSMWICLAGVIVVLVILGFIFRRTKFMQGFFLSCKRIWDGFAVLFHMKGIVPYIWLTLGIWVCYYLETYVCFFAFDFTRDLVDQPESLYGLIPGLVVFVFGSISIAVPSNGGLGPWNIAVMFALTLYGMTDNQGAAFSLVCWTFNALTQIVSGLFGMAYIAWGRRHHNAPGYQHPATH